MGSWRDIRQADERRSHQVDGKGASNGLAAREGKSTFGEELARACEGPIVMISAEGARSMREVYGRVLQALDGPVAKSMHTPDRELAVIRLFRALQVSAFVVDEIQDLAKGTQREHERVLLSIKYLSNTARIPLICLGAPEA